MFEPGSVVKCLESSAVEKSATHVFCIRANRELWPAILDAASPVRAIGGDYDTDEPVVADAASRDPHLGVASTTLTGGLKMATCYLCAYIRTELPLLSDQFPDENPWEWTEALGTCKKCSVWACGLHGTRYSSSSPASFECAICTPAQAIKDAVGIEPDPVAVAEVLRVAPDGDSTDVHRFANALESIRPADERDVLIAQFGGVLPFDLERPRLGLVSGYPPAMAAAVAHAFAGRQLDLRPDSGRIVCGAVNLAREVGDPLRAERPRLWNVRYPQLIDPLVMFVEFVERVGRG
jgi:hypothetical protein